MSKTSIWIAGVGMTPLGKYLDRSIKQMTAQAVESALADAGCTRDSIQAAWFSNTRQGLFEGQHGIRGQCALRSWGLERVPIFNTDNACASSSSGLNLAIAYLRAGMADIALVAGAEKMFYPEKRDLMFGAFMGSMDREIGESQLQEVFDRAAGMPIPEAFQGDHGARSIFMDWYAAVARYHMLRYGTTQRQLAAVAAKNHWHSQWNPLAQYRHAMTIDEVLADKLVSWPLTRSMCAPMSDGAAALVVCNDAGLERLDRSRAIRVLASQVASGITHDIDDSEGGIGRLAAVAAYEEAGLDPKDVSVAEVHDATAFGEIKLTENLGLCAPGDGGRIAEAGETQLGGRIPVNPSGGLASKGHPIGATGALQIGELVTQLRGEAGKRQVPGARIAAAANGGGLWGGEEAVAVVTILGQ